MWVTALSWFHMALLVGMYAIQLIWITNMICDAVGGAAAPETKKKAQ